MWNIGGGEYRIVWPKDNTQLRVGLNDSSLNVDLFLAPERMRAVSGLLGNGNGVYTDDIVPSTGGEPLSLNPPFAQFYGPGGYVESWRVTNATSLFAPILPNKVR